MAGITIVAIAKWVYSYPCQESKVIISVKLRSHMCAVQTTWTLPQMLTTSETLCFEVRKMPTVADM
jgi:hypothetical protein